MVLDVHKLVLGQFVETAITKTVYHQAILNKKK